MTSKGHMLIVDDDPVVGHILGSILRNSGYEVSSVKGLAECFARLNILKQSNTQPVMFWFDMNLEDGTGTELATQVRRDPDYANTPIVFLSASTRQEAVKKTPALENERFLEKPFTPDMALAMLAEVMGTS